MARRENSAISCASAAAAALPVAVRFAGELSAPIGGCRRMAWMVGVTVAMWFKGTMGLALGLCCTRVHELCDVQAQAELVDETMTAVRWARYLE
jgi:hypothetical protein